MKISLVLATLGKDLEEVDFLKSLLLQTYNNFELIIIDQNKEGNLHAEILASHSSIAASAA